MKRWDKELTNNALRRWRRMQIKTWQLFLLALIFSMVGISQLRHNNLRMVQLREDVLVADKHGGDVSAALKKLNNHIFSHMNTTTVRPIELVESYNREVQKTIEEASRQSGRDIYAEAQASCEQRGVPVVAIAQCASDYAAANSSEDHNSKLDMPDKNRFTYSYAAPVWTPDLAGISLLFALILWLWILLRVVEFTLVRLIVRQRARKDFYK